MCQLKNVSFLCMPKMIKISKEAYKKCEIETIVKGQCFCLSRRDLQIESVSSNWAAIFGKCNPNKQKYTDELLPGTKFRPCERFVRDDLAEGNIRSRRLASQKILRIQRKVRIRP